MTIKSFTDWDNEGPSLTEALKAEDYEAAIVIGWHKNNGKKLDLATSGINPGVFKMLQKEKAALKAGELIAKAIAKRFGNKNAKAEQYGRAKSKLTPFWSSYGATDTTPKTDILIGNKRLSLKIGMAQLMSGGKAESTATFYAALKSTPALKKSPEFKQANKTFDGFVTSTLAPGKLRPIIKKGDNPVVNAAEAAHKDCMRDLGQLFEKSAKFKIAFAREAMSGYEKYGKGSNSAAEFMVVASADGSKVRIESVDDDAYCKKIADAMKLQARFKTSGRVVKKQKTGEYNFWSVVSLIVDSMAGQKEDYSNEWYGSLDEGIIDVIKNKVKSLFSRVIAKASSFAKSSVNRLMKFLGAIPEVSFRRNIKF
jgi:hypothetical protein|tara:strand:+ start:275 stop:1378 length:1104 start_codon:yes stop_codon:yes gene_type:complete